MITVGVALALGLAGCRTPAANAPDATVARFFLESTEAQAGLAVLPQSGVRIAVSPKPVLTEFDVANVEIARVELGECLMFQLTPAAARDLYRLSVVNQGRRLVLVLNGEAVGARRIERPLEEGAVLVFVEKPDGALPELVASLRRTTKALQDEAARKS